MPDGIVAVMLFLLACLAIIAAIRVGKKTL
jgi:hypothetical protein